jgi:hypothetical protein
MLRRMESNARFLMFVLQGGRREVAEFRRLRGDVWGRGANLFPTR